MALPMGQEWLDQDQPRLLDYKIGFGGLWTPGDVGFALPSRSAPQNRSTLARDVWLRNGVLIPVTDSAQLGDRPWIAATPVDVPYLLFQFRKHETNGTLTRRFLAYITGPAAGK